MAFRTNCVCGEKLLEEIDESTVTTTAGARYVFRRDTDYVVCLTCDRVYPVSELRDQSWPHLSVVKDEP